MIPDSYPAWRHCIEMDCGIPLTATFIRERIAALDDLGDFRTEQFVRLYGQAHLNRVRDWFAQALGELSPEPV
jgi:hypothetical protein